MKYKRIFVSAVLFASFFSLSFLDAQVKSSSGARSSGTRSSFGSDSRDTDERKGQVQDFMVAILGGMLRHPDPTVRKQAIQSITSGIGGGDNTTSTSKTDGGVKGLFAVDSTRSGSSDEGSGIGAVAYVPDLYVLLVDPDPEVRDYASVGLDVIFGTDITLLRFMSDPDPLIRTYATKIYITKSLSASATRTTTSSRNENEGDVGSLLALRTLLVRLKHETEPAVRKAVVDSLDWFVRMGGGDTRTGTSRDRLGGGDIFGVDAAILEYLNDPDPEIRKHAIKIISEREEGDRVIIKLMERLRVEEDAEVKAELEKAISYFSRLNTRDRRTGEVPVR